MTVTQRAFVLAILGILLAGLVFGPSDASKQAVKAAFPSQVVVPYAFRKSHGRERVQFVLLPSCDFVTYARYEGNPGTVSPGGKDYVVFVFPCMVLAWIGAGVVSSLRRQDRQ